MNTIHVALSSDYNYSRPLAVTIASILANAGADDAFSFHIIDQGLTAACRGRIDALRRLRPFEARYLDLPEERLEEALGLSVEATVARYGFSIGTFSRVFLPEFLPELPRILYLDCDLMVLDSLMPLWETPLEGKSAACARDALEYLRPIRDDMAAFIDSLGLPEDGVYFNAGVMLMNLEKAREQDMAGRFFERLRQLGDRARYPDQDALNLLFHEDYIILPSMWNFPDSMSKWSPEFTFASPNFTPKIIHFTAWDKPWKANHDCVHHDLYNRYAEMTGWRIPTAQDCKARTDEIHIAFVSDRNYARPLAVTIASILANAGPDDAFWFHVIDLGLSEECRERIDALRQIREFQIEYLELPADRLRAMSASPLEDLAAEYNHSLGIFGRVFLPELLPNLPRVLYLDCDLLVLDSLQPLWETDLKGKYAMCARDATEHLRWMKDVAAHVAALGIREDEPYFNSGVMLLNLDKARKRNMKRRFFALLEQFTHALEYPDQDIFNIMFQGDYVVLHSMWNCQDVMCQWKPDYTPKIIHYTTREKPWKTGASCANAGLYRHYAEMTGWQLAPDGTQAQAQESAE